MIALIVCLLAGMFLIGAGVAQGVRVRRLGRDGRRVQGAVVRVERSRDGKSLYSPVISYPDESGRHHEFTVGLKAFRSLHGLGAQVPVLHLPHRPDTAWLNSVRHNVLMIGVPPLIGVLFIGAGILFAS
ncbi:MULTISPECIES: DUF3592 domain-containing protein [Actinoplanes]|uniref:DUF3592 domain-containing protein n=1 Tax=Actinoplanes TaxID=1865 RepID=UPI0005F2C800|nr:MULTISPECIES: DUF3592 domain-containing protein [Actinoplanes]